MKKVRESLAGWVAVGLTVFTVGTSNAALVDAGEFAGTDCGGAGGFAACRATTTGTQQGGTEGSPVIYKRESGGGQDFGTFASVTGAEFTLTFDGNTHVLSWTYTPGTGDPEIHYFDIKQADSYHLYYDLTSPITSFTLDLDTIGYNAFSHVTWYDTAGGGPNTPAVPEPANVALLGLGLAVLGFARRRRVS